MIHIAICDDSKQERQILAALFKRYQELHATPLQIHIFQNGFSLLDAIDQGKRFDITILDILMPGENGIEIARNIRASGADTEIIFLTSSPEYAVDSYEVKAQNYLLKPVTEEKFFASIDSILAELDEKDTASFIIYTTEKQYSRIRVSSLVYGEHTQNHHLTSGRSDHDLCRNDLYGISGYSESLSGLYISTPFLCGKYELHSICYEKRYHPDRRPEDSAFQK